MLARPDIHRCIECGKPYGSDTFDLHYGRADHGPAYWCDRGLLCSPRCSLDHHRRREAEGTVQKAPAPNPLDPDGF